MNALIRPPLTREWPKAEALPERHAYLGYEHVSAGDYERWVSCNCTRLALNFYAQARVPDMAELAAFSAREWERERETRSDMASLARNFDGAI